MKYLTFVETGQINYAILFKNKYLGDLKFHDSTWLFFEDKEDTGGWYWYILQEIADKLKELNEPIDNAGRKEEL